MLFLASVLGVNVMRGSKDLEVNSNARVRSKSTVFAHIRGKRSPYGIIDVIGWR